MVERTFVMIKPDAVYRRLIGKIIERLERSGLKLVAMKFLRMSREQAEALYKVHEGKPFYESLIEYVTSGPVVVMIREGPKAIEIVRKLIGATDPSKAAPGTIRGDFALSISYNVIHASDSEESYEYEHKIFFSEEEIVSRKALDEDMIF